MSVYITDAAEQYEANASANKILLDSAVILASNFLSDEAIFELNVRNSASEVTAGDDFVREQERLAASLSKEHLPEIPFLDHKPAYEQVYSLLFHRLSEYGKYRFQLHHWIASFLDFQQDQSIVLNFDLDHQYSWIRQSRETLNWKGELHIRPQQNPGGRNKQRLKNLLQTPYSFLKPPKKADRSKTNVVIVTYNILHHIRIFEKYVQHTLATTDYELHFVVASSGLNSDGDLITPLFGGHSRVHVHAFESFRTTHFMRPDDILDAIISQEPELAFLRSDPHFSAMFTQYHWMSNLFAKLSPAICLTVNLHEIGRAMVDVAVHSDVPSVQVDYALFADHHLMNARIAFTARAVLSDAVTAVWEKRGDTALKRVPIGFTKLDDSQPAEALTKDKKTFFEQHGLDPQLPTLFFASTWSAPGEIYGVEKVAIVKAISSICERNGYNLLVKKHPLEQDDTLEQLVAGKPHQRIFKHAEISLEKAIAVSDFVTTQGSSVVLEALYYGKMPVFLGIGSKKQLILAGMTSNDDVIYFSDFAAFDSLLQELVGDEAARKAFDARVEEKTAFILHKTDGKAYLRLFGLVEELLKRP